MFMFFSLPHLPPPTTTHHPPPPPPPSSSTTTHHLHLHHHPNAPPSSSQQRHFSVFALSFPGADALTTIYTSILAQRLGGGQEGFGAALQRSGPGLVQLALALHQRVSHAFLPTALKFHYRNVFIACGRASAPAVPRLGPVNNSPRLESPQMLTPAEIIGTAVDRAADGGGVFFFSSSSRF
ncbi:hypothetical protein CRUP_006795 [Coryphaenoides rupestris]|nr:hypothetical protein CRUP_006795 [Coryphaenoides rupestris]